MKKLSILFLLFFVFVAGFSQNQPVQDSTQNIKKLRKIVYIHLGDTTDTLGSVLSLYNSVLKRENLHQRKVLQGMIKEVLKDKDNFALFRRPFILEGQNASRQQLYNHLDAIPEDNNSEYVLVLSIGTHGIQDAEGSPYPSIRLYNPITGGSLYYKVSDLVDNLKNKYSKKFSLVVSVISACNAPKNQSPQQTTANNSQNQGNSGQGITIAGDPNASNSIPTDKSNRKLFLQDGFVLLLGSQTGLYTYGENGKFLHVAELEVELRNAFIMDTLGVTTFKDIFENVKTKTSLSAKNLNVKQIPFYEIDVRDRNSSDSVSGIAPPSSPTNQTNPVNPTPTTNATLTNRAYQYLLNSSSRDVVSYLNVLQDVQDASIGRTLAEEKWSSIIINFFDGNGAAKYQTSNLKRKTIHTQNIEKYLQNLYNYLTRRNGKLYVDIDIHLEDWSLGKHGLQVVDEKKFKPIANKKNEWEGTIKIKQHFIGTKNKRNKDPAYTDYTIKTFTVRVIYDPSKDSFFSYFTRVDAEIPSLPDGCTPAE